MARIPRRTRYGAPESMGQLTLLIMKLYRPERGANRYRMCLSIVMWMFPDRIREWNGLVCSDCDDMVNLG